MMVLQGIRMLGITTILRSIQPTVLPTKLLYLTLPYYQTTIRVTCSAQKHADVRATTRQYYDASILLSYRTARLQDYPATRLSYYTALLNYY